MMRGSQQGLCLSRHRAWLAAAAIANRNVRDHRPREQWGIGRGDYLLAVVPLP